MNPLISPWNKPSKPKFISDKQLYFRWNAIAVHLKNIPAYYENNGTLAITIGNEKIYLAKNAQKMRLKSHLDWTYYTPKTLAQAIDNNNVDQYYEIMLHDVNSDPNLWKDKDFEMELKSFYAARANRASLI